MKFVTYWLYFGNRVLASVRLPEGTPAPKVRAVVKEREAKCPSGHAAWEAPFEFQNKLSRADVRL